MGSGTESEYQTPDMNDVIPLVEKLVHRNCIKFRTLEREEDIRQEIFVRILSPSPSVKTTYLERFNPSKNSLEGFLSRLIYNYFCRIYTRGQYAVERAKSIDELFDVGERSYDLQAVSSKVDAEKVFKSLEEKYPYTSGVMIRPPLKIPPDVVSVVKREDNPKAVNGDRILWRSVANIFTLILSGMSQEEVATVMLVSKGWVSKQVHKIRQQEDISAWASELGISAGPQSRRKKVSSSSST